MPSNDQNERLIQAVERLTQMIEGLRIDLAETFEEPEPPPRTRAERLEAARKRRFIGPAATVAALGLAVMKSPRFKAAAVAATTGAAAAFMTWVIIHPSGPDDDTARPQQTPSQSPSGSATPTPTPTTGTPTDSPTSVVEVTRARAELIVDSIPRPTPRPTPTTGTTPQPPDATGTPTAEPEPTLPEPPVTPPTTTGPPLQGGEPDCVVRVGVNAAGAKVRICVET